MSAAQNLLRQSIEMGHFLTQAYVGDLTESDLLVRSVPCSNHIAWQLGHMIVGVRHMMAAIGHDTPPLPDGFEAAHSKETSASDDCAKFATKAEYLKLLDEMKSASLAAVDATSDEEMDKPGPEEMREYAPTVGAILMLLGTHLTMHTGQFVPIRRKLGKGPIF